MWMQEKIIIDLSTNNHGILRKIRIFYVDYGFGLLDYGFWIDDDEEDN